MDTVSPAQCLTSEAPQSCSRPRPTPQSHTLEGRALEMHREGVRSAVASRLLEVTSGIWTAEGDYLVSDSMELSGTHVTS